MTGPKVIPQTLTVWNSHDSNIGHHFTLNGHIRLWLCTCVDEVIAEILTVPGIDISLMKTTERTKLNS